MKRTMVFSAKKILALSVRVTPRQMSAVIVMLAMMLPISVPIRGRAFELDLPPVPAVNAGLALAKSSEVTTFAAFGSRLIERTAELFSLVPLSDGRDISDPDPGVRLKALEDRVKDIEVSISESIHLSVGQSILLSAVPVDENGETVHGVVPKWTSKNSAVVRIRDGRAIAVGAGETVLTVTTGSVTKDDVNVAVAEE